MKTEEEREIERLEKASFYLDHLTANSYLDAVGVGFFFFFCGILLSGLYPRQRLKPSLVRLLYLSYLPESASLHLRGTRPASTWFGLNALQQQSLLQPTKVHLKLQYTCIFYNFSLNSVTVRFVRIGQSFLIIHTLLFFKSLACKHGKRGYGYSIDKNNFSFHCTIMDG